MTTANVSKIKKSVLPDFTFILNVVSGGVIFALMDSFCKTKNNAYFTKNAAEIIN